MGRPKGGKNRYWSKEEKIRIINRVLADGMSARQVAIQESISDGMLCTWIKKYLEQCKNALENKNKPGNPLAKYSRRKELSELEKLEYENMKLRIENERLKKATWWKEMVQL